MQDFLKQSFKVRVNKKTESRESGKLFLVFKAELCKIIDKKNTE
tara:strand:- start:824 stop:955 length:132 start_codon:yes stop_codon:yes gene_type:complete